MRTTSARRISSPGPPSICTAKAACQNRAYRSAPRGCVSQGDRRATSTEGDARPSSEARRRRRRVLLLTSLELDGRPQDVRALIREHVVDGDEGVEAVRDGDVQQGVAT